MKTKDVFDFKPYTAQSALSSGHPENWMIVFKTDRKILADGFKTRTAAMDFARKYLKVNTQEKTS